MDKNAGGFLGQYFAVSAVARKNGEICALPIRKSTRDPIQDLHDVDASPPR